MNNEVNVKRYCTNCGAELNENQECPNCKGKVIMTDEEKEKQTALGLVILTTINLIIALIAVVPFFFFWLFADAFSSYGTASSASFLFLGYLLSSVALFVIALINKRDNGANKKRNAMIAVICLIICFGASFFLINKHEIFSKNYYIPSDVKIFEDTHSYLYQKKLVQYEKNLELILDSDEYTSITFEMDYVIINGKEVPCSYDKEGYYGTTHIITVSNEELKKNGIDKVESYEFIIHPWYPDSDPVTVEIKMK